MGRDVTILCALKVRMISIHSPRMGRDAGIAQRTDGLEDFNPLSPHGERPLNVCRSELAELFQSTLPAWGETIAALAAASAAEISIHSPRMGRDGLTWAAVNWQADFNPLSPHGERRPGRHAGHDRADFNPLSPHGERLSRHKVQCQRLAISIHSPRMGRDAP